MAEFLEREGVRYSAQPLSVRLRLSDTPSRWPLLFVSLSLLALAIVPAFLWVRISRIEDRISQVLDPARTMLSELALIHSHEMSSMQEYILTGRPESRDRYE